MTEENSADTHNDGAETEGLAPQLMMVRHSLANLPPVQTPAPYTLRTFREEDVAAWEEIVAESFEKPPGTYRFDALVRNLGRFRPERVFFVVGPDGKPVATATALLKANNDPILAALHMVGVLHSHKGKRLGYWASLAALHQHAQEGATAVSLLTDDFRLPAVKTYLNLEFEPYLVHENQRERWSKVLSVFSDSDDWLARFSDILEGLIHDSDAEGG